MTRIDYYNHLIEKAYRRIENIKNLPYYRIFNRPLEQKKHIREKLELIEWLTKRKMSLAA